MCATNISIKNEFNVTRRIRQTICQGGDRATKCFPIIPDRQPIGLDQGCSLSFSNQVSTGNCTLETAQKLRSREERWSREGQSSLPNETLAPPRRLAVNIGHAESRQAGQFSLSAPNARKLRSMYHYLLLSKWVWSKRFAKFGWWSKYNAAIAREWKPNYGLAARRCSLHRQPKR